MALTSRIARELRTEVAITRWREKSLLRLSAQVYNSPVEYERLAAGIRELLQP